MRNKRLLIVSTEFPPGPGGIGSHAYQVIKELKRLGWEIEVITEQNNTGEDEIEKFNRTITDCSVKRIKPTPSLWLLIKKLLFIIWRVIVYRPAVVIGTGKHACWFAVLASKVTFKKCVCVGHGTEFTKNMSPKVAAFNKWVFNNCNAIIAVSKFTEGKIKDAKVAAPITVIQNGANQDFFKKLDTAEVEAFKTEKGVNGQKIVITIGNVSERKGQQMVIQAMPEILRQVPAAHYYCVGVPTVADVFEQQARQLGVDNRVHFLGKLTARELLLWLNASDVFAMTSITTQQGSFEGFGIAVIEAAMCGKPAVVYSNSGLAEAVEDGETGYVVEERNIGATAQTIAKLLINDSIKNELGANAYKRAWEQYTWKQKAELYNRFLLNI